MQSSKKRSLPKTCKILLFNPFNLIGPQAALILGLAILLLTARIASLTRNHFIGLGNIISDVPAPYWKTIVEGLICWIVYGIILMIMGCLFARTRKLKLQLLCLIALANWPLIILALALLASPAQPVFIAAYTIEFSWRLYLLYKAYTASYPITKTSRALIGFILAVLIAELIAQTLLLDVIRII